LFTEGRTVHTVLLPGRIFCRCAPFPMCLPPARRFWLRWFFSLPRDLIGPDVLRRSVEASQCDLFVVPRVCSGGRGRTKLQFRVICYPGADIMHLLGKAYQYHKSLSNMIVTGFEDLAPAPRSGTNTAMLALCGNAAGCDGGKTW